MPLFRPNQTCSVVRPQGFNAYGEETLGTPVEVACSFIKILAGTVVSSLRTDTSASHGAAKEVAFESRIFFPPTTDIRIGDKVTAAGQQLRVESVEQKFNINGRLDYLDVGLVSWGGS